MSKVKGETCGIRKVKLRRSLRRMETNKKELYNGGLYKKLYDIAWTYV